MCQTRVADGAAANYEQNHMFFYAVADISSSSFF